MTSQTSDIQPSRASRVSTGITGLDDILGGGLSASRIYLVEGTPGSGKTTLALQFLQAGIAAGERCLYVSLSETREELQVVIESHGFRLEGMSVVELSSAATALGADQEVTLLHPWEVELGETIRLIAGEVERSNPTRLVFDSLSELRLLAQDSLRYRRQILSLKQFFSGRSATVLMLDDLTAGHGEFDQQLHSLSHGVITLERLSLDFGPARRRMEVQKMRGAPFRAGYHDFNIVPGGLEVFPRLIAAEHHAPFGSEPVSSGVAGLDALLAGGPLRGTCTLISGPAGAGKTSLALQYIASACARGERCAMYEFDERIATLMARAAQQGLDLGPLVGEQRLTLEQIDPADISPGEFASMIRHAVEVDEVKLIVIDSLTGYESAMPYEKQLMLQMHELLSYLNQRGVVTFLIDSQHGLVGSMSSRLNISYIADAVVLLRFFEAGGMVKKAIAVLKNRGGGHESTIRELSVDRTGIHVGEPLTGFQGVLTGTPTFLGSSEPLIGEPSEGA